MKKYLFVCIFVLLANVNLFSKGGDSFITAVPASLDSNNISSAGQLSNYYYFTPNYNGYVTLGNCGLTLLDTEVQVFDSLKTPIYRNDDYCGMQSSLTFPVDSLMKYYIYWTSHDGISNETYNWYLIEAHPLPGDLCSLPIKAAKGINYVNIPEPGTQWFEYTVSEPAKVFISIDPGLKEEMENWDIEIYNNCNSYKQRFGINDSTIGFIADYSGDYNIVFSHSKLGDTNGFDWTITEEAILPGESCVTPRVADTGNNIFHSEKIQFMYYKFQLPDDGVVTVNLCGVPEDIYAHANIYSGSCNSLSSINDLVESSCSAYSKYKYSFYADSGKYYYIKIESESFTDFNWKLHFREPIPGEICEQASVVDTGNVEYKEGYKSELYYSYHSTEYGGLKINMCDIPENVIDYVFVYSGGCENLNIIDDIEYEYCSNNKDLKFYTDSAETYIIKVIGSVDTIFYWKLSLEDTYPGQFKEIAIPVEFNDTVVLKPVPNTNDIWYEFYSESDKMITISSCNLENEISGINYISASEKKSKNMESVWYSNDHACVDGIKLEFPADSGKSYLINLSYFLSSNNSVKWSLTGRDFEIGEKCASGTIAESGTEYSISSGMKFSWHYYIPDKDEYKVISKISELNFSGNLIVKEDCDCEPGLDPGCKVLDWYGYGFFLEAGKKYNIGWINTENEETVWKIYDLSDFIGFSIKDQTKPPIIDNENRTIQATIGHEQNIKELIPYFNQPKDVYFKINDKYQRSGSKVDFSNPVTYTITFIDNVNDTIVSYDWIVTVNQEAAPPQEPFAVKSQYLKNPDLTKPFVSNWADFWKTAYDNENGGFFTNVDQKGNVTGNSKSTLSQSRNAYAFARAFMVTGDTAYLNYANGALQFMYTYLWDKTNGGWYSSVDRFGGLISSDNYNTFKWSFIQHYAKLGIVAMAEATGGARFENHDVLSPAFNERGHWEMLNSSLDVINERMWDSRDNYYGYYNRAGLDWSNPDEKGFTPTVDGITTHGLYIYLLTKDPFYYTRLEQLANNIEEHMIPEMKSAVIGYPEAYNNNWEMKQGGDMFIGHMFKTAWCLARAYLVNPQERYREAAKVLMYDMIDNGAYDYIHGAPYTGYDWSDGSINTNSKSWWDVEQAYTSGIMNYYISDSKNDKEKFIEVADGSIDFFMNNFVDPVYGEVHESTNREGIPSETTKGHYWKAGYHSTEFAYYAYLYGKLFYKGEPVSLYYFIDSSPEAQAVSLYPLAIEDNYLKISKVELDGIPFKNFNKDTRTLNISANEGGVFKVTFINSRFATGINEPIANMSLDVDVCPNPIVTSGAIQYTVDTYTDVSINIVDITGKVIHSVNYKDISPGTYQETIHRENLNNNVCVVQVKTNSQSNSKLLLMY